MDEENMTEEMMEKKHFIQNKNKITGETQSTYCILA